MSDSGEALPFASLMQALRALTEQSATGTLMIATDDNHSARFVLDRGGIVAVAFGRLRGMEAVAAMRGIRAGRHRFARGVQVGASESQSLPPTPELVATLLGDGGPAQPSAEPGDTLATAPDRIRAVVVEEVAELLGPIATLICDEHFASRGVPTGRRALEGLLEALAAELPDPTRARALRERVLARID